MASRYERRLAAILCADVVGYTKLMASDEHATIDALKDSQRRIAKWTEHHGGRLVDLAGDCALAVFQSVVQCVGCAIDIQRDLLAANRDRRGHEMEFRIGIHLGDLAIDETSVYGDGVNIAARLQTLAAPGGVCISEAVLEQVRNHLHLSLESLGAQEVKNVPLPVIAYRIELPDPGDQPGRTEAPAETAEAPALFERPSIAVLPFDNLTGDPGQEYFADGLCEDLTTQLSLFRFLPVLARNSCFQYKSRPVDVKQVRRDLGAQYVVEGSLRRYESRIRVNAQLIDTTTGHHIWAERYDREIGDFFGVQDEIVDRIAASIHQQLAYAEPRRVVRRSRPDLDAWDIAQRGWWHANRRTREDNIRAQERFREAIARDPEFVWAYYGLVVTLAFDVFYQWTKDLAKTVLEILEVSQASMRLDPNDPHALLATSIGQAVAGELPSAILTAERAVELNPSLAFGHYLLGFHLSVGGDPARALESVQRAIALSPRDPILWVYHAAEASCYFALEDHERVLEVCRGVLQLRPEFPNAHALLTASCARLGRLDQARDHLAAMLRAQPEFTVDGFRASFRGAEPEIVDRLVQGLYAAGLPHVPPE